MIQINESHTNKRLNEKRINETIDTHILLRMILLARVQLKWHYKAIIPFNLQSFQVPIRLMSTSKSSTGISWKNQGSPNATQPFKIFSVTTLSLENCFQRSNLPLFVLLIHSRRWGYLIWFLIILITMNEKGWCHRYSWLCIICDYILNDCIKARLLKLSGSE